MRRFIAALAVISCFLAAPPVFAGAGESFDALYARLTKTREILAVAISPDGSRVARVEPARNEKNPRASRILVQEACRGAPAVRITASPDDAPVREGNVAFSPDGRTLAFVSHVGGAALWIAPVSGGSALRLTKLKGVFQEPLWSRDGRSLAVLVVENPSKEPGPVGPAARDSGVVEERIDEQRIAVVDVGAKSLRFVSPPDLYVYEYAWSADGRTFAAVGAKGSGDDNWWRAELLTVDAGSGATRLLWKPPLQIANPVFSPDGSAVAVIHGLMSDHGATGGDVFVVPAAGGEARNLTPGRRASAGSLAWPTASRMLVTELAGEATAVVSLDPVTGAARTLFSGNETLSRGPGLGLALARDGTSSAVVRESFDAPPEVWAGPIGAWVRVTEENAGVRPDWGPAASVRVTSDGQPVQGWLLPPARVDARKKHPLAVFVHGGPAAAHRDAWPTPLVGSLLARGYFVFLPNPRGSFGQGEAFTGANVKDFGGGDLRDILAGLDEVLRTRPVDPKRVGLFGWSYGGYMAMWTVTQTNRFAAAVAGAGIVNWQSYYGQNRIDTWMLPYFGASVYDDPAVYAKSSPLTFIKNVRTPTLVLHGERDAEVPAAQGYEFWHALKTLGVPTQLVIYPDEGHGLTREEDKKDRVLRVLGWFDRWLK
ncbi:MAG TPA: S9 family peptidase [Thermoanaerobaculia bacterium]|nr:S9 family peptidase [Thermoanaerobaculia bacterium]